MRGKYEVLQWVNWQMGGLGPMAGQANHFNMYAPQFNPVEQLTYGQQRYSNEVNRLFGVLNKRLADHEFIAGAYSIADMASWPWVVGFKNSARISTISPTSSAGSRSPWVSGPR